MARPLRRVEGSDAPRRGVSGLVVRPPPSSPDLLRSQYMPSWPSAARRTAQVASTAFTCVALLAAAGPTAAQAAPGDIFWLPPSFNDSVIGCANLDGTGASTLITRLGHAAGVAADSRY